MKPKIYLIPGTMCNEKLWNPLKEAGSGEFEFVHIPIPDEDSIDEMVEVIVDKLLPDKFILLGFSFGGYISSRIAAKVPERTEHLFVISNSPCSLKNREIDDRKTSLKLIDKYGYRGISTGKASSLLDSGSVDDDLVQTIIKMDSEMGVDNLINQLKVGSDRGDLALPLSKSNVNITFVFSEEDQLINKEWIFEFVKRNPKCSSVSISGSGHMLPLERPYEILEILQCS
jgi:pimeloyl-ACP methyl ester carboxylesterase